MKRAELLRKNMESRAVNMYLRNWIRLNIDKAIDEAAKKNESKIHFVITDGRESDLLKIAGLPSIGAVLEAIKWFYHQEGFEATENYDTSEFCGNKMLVIRW